MKKFGMFLMFVLAMAVAMPASYAQFSKKELRTIEKNAKKEAKALTKEGWKVAPGLPTIEMQLTESFKMQMYDAALFQAQNLSKMDLAGKMETRVIQIIDNKLANKEISQQDATSLATSISAGKNLVAQKLGQVANPVKLYRSLPNGNVEVRVIVYYSQALAMRAAKEAMRGELEKEASDLAKELDELLGD